MASAAGIEIRPAAGAGDTAATLQWVKPGDDAWKTGQPTFSVVDPSGLKATGYIAATPDALLLRLDVTDQVHVNSQDGGNIWNGDFVRVSLDARGDGPHGGAANTVGMFGPDDCSIGFALTPKGPQGWTYNTLVSKLEGAYPADLLNFSRDESKKLTRYDITIPWSRLDTQPGAFPAFGIAIGFRSVDQENGPITQAEWGHGANGPVTGEFNRVAYGNAPAIAPTIVPLKTAVWDTQDHAVVHVAVDATKAATLKVSDGTTEQTEAIPAGSGVARRTIEYTPSADATSATLQVSVESQGAGAVTEKVPVQLAEQVVKQTVNELRTVAATSPNPLFTWHLRSVEALIWKEWGRAALYKHANEAEARKTLNFVEDIQKGFAPGAPATKWETYYEVGMPLTIAFDSSRDHTTQYYTMTLPKGWDPTKSRDEQKAYPFFVELHGAGDAHLLNGPASYYGGATYGGLGYKGAGTYEMRDRAGYHIMPFGRGNSGYRDIGETDVWEALADFDRRFKTDPEHTYLFGFSMGGGGTFNLGRETPDKWAAIAILGMGARPTEWQAKNLSMVPVYIWGGQEDPIAFRGGKPKDIIEHFAEMVKAAGGEVKAWSSPGIGHNYLGEVQKDSIEWLKTHTRKRPDKFTFTVDDDRHPGVWGITIRRDENVAGLPSFSVAIDGSTVNITTHAVSGTRVVLGDEGLKMTGDVTLMIDGKEAYKGPATNRPVTVGDVGFRRFGR